MKHPVPVVRLIILNAEGKTLILKRRNSEYVWIGPSEMERYDIAFRHDLGLIRFRQERSES